MYKLKYLKTIILFVVSSILLIACSGQSSEVILEMDTDKYFSEVIYETENDKILKQKTTNIVSYEVLQVDSKDEAEEAIQEAMEEFANIEGIEHTVQFEDERLIEEVYIDYEIVELNTVGQVPGLPTKGEEGTLSLEASVDTLESQGYLLVE